MKDDEITKAMKEAYKWRVVDGKAMPPKTHFPEFVNKRIEWLSYEMQNNDAQLNFLFVIKLLFDTAPEHEPKMKKDFELGSLQSYLPMTEEYREWIEDFPTTFFRQQAVLVAFMYFQGKAKEVQP